MEIREGLQAFDELGKGRIIPHEAHYQVSSKNLSQPRPSDNERYEYLTLIVRDVSAFKAFLMAMSFLGNSPSELHLAATSRHSRRSQSHGSSRNHIVLHVMLSRRRHRTRC